MKKPTAGQVLNGVGLSLLAACFMFAAYRILTRTAEEANSETKVLRFAHWQLEFGIRDAFDVLAREYESTHPGVIIKQIAIPERIWRNWTTTQLIGGTAPDLIQIGRMTTTQISRFFRPISEYVDLPNPYNKGTNLEGLAWRSTFHDNLETSYNRELMDYYGVSPFNATIRAYYNQDLLRKYTGSADPPLNLPDFMEVCEQVRTRSEAEGHPVYPIAGSIRTGEILFDRLAQAVTQRLSAGLNEIGSFPVLWEDFFMAYLTGRWSFYDPPLQDALNLMREFSREMTPGFLSLSREDATFYFLQQRALMIPTGSYDISSIVDQARFPIIIAPIPIPDPDHPVYGHNLIAKPAEGGIRMNGPLGITYASKHPELALDFLRFLSSQKANQTFTDVSRWLPVIRGVEVDDAIKPFIPDRSGFPPGPTFRTGVESRRVTETQIHLLMSDSNDAIDYADIVTDQYARGMKRDLETATLRFVRNVMRDDSTYGAYEHLASTRPDNSDYAHRLTLIRMSQTRQEARYEDLTRQMDQLP